jgi:hypothetical protein
MARYKFTPAKPRDEPSMEEIEAAINSATVQYTEDHDFEGEDYIVMSFMYGGLVRDGVIKNKRVDRIFPYGYKAQRVADRVLKHILEFPHDYLPKDVMLRVLLGND